MSLVPLWFAVICLSTGRKLNFSKYIFDSLVRNVDSSTKFDMYPRFLQLMIRAQVGAPKVDVEDVPTAGVVVKGVASVVDDDVNAAVDEPFIPSPTPPTPPPQPSQDQPSTSQAQPTLPQSPQAQPQSPQH
nr:hypothetical protein [Tanacetum cinerariifolium]